MSFSKVFSYYYFSVEKNYLQVAWIGDVSGVKSSEFVQRQTNEIQSHVSFLGDSVPSRLSKNERHAEWNDPRAFSRSDKIFERISVSFF